MLRGDGRRSYSKSGVKSVESRASEIGQIVFTTSMTMVRYPNGNCRCFFKVSKSSQKSSDARQVILPSKLWRVTKDGRVEILMAGRPWLKSVNNSLLGTGDR